MSGTDTDTRDAGSDPVGNDLIRRIEDGVCWITLNRPEAGNALTQFMRDRIAEWVRDASSDLFVRAVVITGAGDKAFCAGNDLKWQAAGGKRGWDTGGFAGLTSRFDCDKPIIAAVNGVAMGEALDLDHLGRPLPVWHGCCVVAGGDVFLVNRQSGDSLDGRYFGPLPTTAVVGRADPLWTDQEH